MQTICDYEHGALFLGLSGIAFKLRFPVNVSRLADEAMMGLNRVESPLCAPRPEKRQEPGLNRMVICTSSKHATSFSVY